MDSNIQQGNSDYRVSQNEQTYKRQQPTKTYSSVLNQTTSIFPSKKQAIIFTALENVKLEDYLVALGAVVQPNNIIFSSRISNNRICIYLASEQILENFMNINHGTIKIDHQIIQARRLITPNERLILSNVSPSIPHDILETELKNLGIKLVSPITFLRIGTTNPDFKHILSFRRQTYISPPDQARVPESILVTHELTSYRIFLSLDQQTCFTCKQIGHQAQNCPTNQNPNEDAENHINETPQTTIHENFLGDTIEDIYFPSIQPNEIFTKSTIVSPIVTPSIETPPTSSQPETSISMTLTTPTPTPSKRTLSEISTPSPQPIFNKPNFEQKKQKKVKTNPPIAQSPTIEELMKPTKAVFEDEASNFSLNYQEVSHFLENVYGSSDPLSVAKTYTSNVSELLDILTKIYPFFTDRKIKARCSKIQNRIKKQLLLETLSDTDASKETDASQVTY
ncbi:uncharacterized protein isoform X1 [Leptinotarsa decemlineata]|uniref:uncharacterized protein isoform X1 n=1 Tax=Leptinotarsa decemlineata TaxID=7539 RepID=UPI003D30729F